MDNRSHLQLHKVDVFFQLHKVEQANFESRITSNKRNQTDLLHDGYGSQVPSPSVLTCDWLSQIQQNLQSPEEKILSHTLLCDNEGMVERIKAIKDWDRIFPNVTMEAK
jgi:hypothetical protein